MNYSSNLFRLYVLSISLFLTSCSQTATDNNKNVTRVASKDFQSTVVSKETFNTWNDAWKTHWKTDSIVYFTMPLQDLVGVLGESDVDSARFYLGYSEEDSIAHLTVVGVDSLGRSMINAEHAIYDVSMPCPPGCNNVN